MTKQLSEVGANVSDYVGHQSPENNTYANILKKQKTKNKIQTVCVSPDKNYGSGALSIIEPISQQA